MTSTTNMNLVLPVPATTPGIQWATLLNAAMTLVDAHDHSSGKGVRITPAGMNINQNLSFAGYEATTMKALGLDGTTPTGTGKVYQSGGNLYWLNGAGAAVQITSGGSINVSSLGTIGGDYSTDPANPSVTFSTASGDYDFFKSTTSGNVPGGINAGVLTLFEETAGSLGISIQSPSSLASAYTITLPTAQAAANNSLISVSSAGAMSFTRAPTATSLGIGSGSLGSLSLYNESDTNTGMYFSSTDTIDFVNGGAKSININSDRATEFSPASVSNLQPNAGAVKIGNAGSGSKEPSIASYATGGASVANYMLYYMGTSDDVSSSSPVVNFNARRNTDTPFGTKEEMFRFSNFSTTLMSIGRNYTSIYDNVFTNDFNGAIFGSNSVSSWPTSAVGRDSGRWMFTSSTTNEPFIMVYQSNSSSGSPGIRFQSLSSGSASASSTIKQYRPAGYAANSGSGLTFRIQETGGTEVDAMVLDADGYIYGAIAASTFTPTISLSTGSGVSSLNASYQKINNIVTVWVHFIANASGGNIVGTCTLPVSRSAGNFSSSNQIQGIASATSINESMFSTTGAQTVGFSFTPGTLGTTERVVLQFSYSIT